MNLIPGLFYRLMLSIIIPIDSSDFDTRLFQLWSYPWHPTDLAELAGDNEMAE